MARTRHGRAHTRRQLRLALVRRPAPVSVSPGTPRVRSVPHPGTISLYRRSNDQPAVWSVPRGPSLRRPSWWYLLSNCASAPMVSRWVRRPMDSRIGPTRQGPRSGTKNTPSPTSLATGTRFRRPTTKKPCAGPAQEPPPAVAASFFPASIHSAATSEFHLFFIQLRVPTGYDGVRVLIARRGPCR